MSQLTDRFLIGAGIVSGLLTLFVFSGTSLAVSGSSWQAGRIMDNSIFFNSNTMSTGSIQSFLDAKMPTCATNHAKSSNPKDSGPKYTCLKNYSENPTTHVNNSDSGGGIPVSGGWSAARIIKHAANSYNVSPKVLLVLLQKEQSLVTDDWPWAGQYRSATGFGCPDNAPCNSEYYGFYNQVMKAAYQFRRYATYPSSYRYKAFQTNSIQWSPNAACGSSNVYIQNQSTAGLYNYTPYQPNASALNNLYGTGNTCSAYGNRNFWRMYHDWFGSTYGPSYSWQYQGQSLYTDNTKTTSVDSINSSLKPGARYYAVISIKNTGNVAWSQGNFRLGTSRPGDRSSSIYDPSWLTAKRPATLTEASVQPEGTGTFEFWIKVPNTAINTKEYFTPLQEGVTWLQDIGLHYNIRNTGQYSWQYQGQSLYTNNSKTSSVNFYNQILSKDTRYYAVVRLKNTGNVTWYQGNFRLGVSRPTSRTSVISDPSWTVPQTRAATLVESAVRPGEIGTFEFWIKTPNSSVRLKEYFTPLQENISWLNDIGLHYIINTY